MGCRSWSRNLQSVFEIDIIIIVVIVVGGGYWDLLGAGVHGVREEK
jgi:hypothetical protein